MPGRGNPDINEKYVFYYAARGYRSGLTVTIDVQDTLGAKEIDAGTMTEMGSTGIYTFNFFPRKRTFYVAIMDAGVFAHKSHQVIDVKKR